jgi:hypothetical protein
VARNRLAGGNTRETSIDRCQARLRDERSTTASVLPVVNGDLSSVKKAGVTLPCPATTPNCEFLQPDEVNPNFGHVTAYQTPRIFRCGLRTTF